MSLFRRNIILLFTFVFLFLSTGVSYYQSFCNEGCDTKLALFGGINECCDEEEEKEESCHDDHGHEEAEDECCGVEKVSIAMDVDMETNDLLSFQFQTFELEIQPAYVSECPLCESTVLTSESRRGPPLPVKSGRVLLLEKNTFLI